MTTPGPLTAACVVCAAPWGEACVLVGLSRCGSLTVDRHPHRDGVHDARLIRLGLLAVAEPAAPEPAVVRPRCKHPRWRVDPDAFCVEECTTCGQGRYVSPAEYEERLAAQADRP